MNGRTYLALLCVGVSLCSMLYQFNLLRIITWLTDSVPVWEPFVIASYMAGLGLMSLYMASREFIFSWLSFVKVEAILALYGSLSISLVLIFHSIYRSYFHIGLPLEQEWYLQPLNIFGFVCLLVPFLLGGLSGLELSLLFKKFSLETDHAYSCLYLTYYFGGLLGTFIFSFILLPQLDEIRLAQFTSLFNIFICFIIIFFKKIKIYRLPILQIAIGVALLSVLFGTSWQSIHLNLFYYNRLSWTQEGQSIKFNDPLTPLAWLRTYQKLPEIKSVWSPYQKIHLVPDVESKTGAFTMFLNGHFQFQSQLEPDYHEHFAHIPVMIADFIPKKVLIIGGGDGLLLREILKYGNDVEFITLVDLDKFLVRYAKRELSILNQGSLEHDKVRIVNEDALFFLRNSTATYDAIFADVPFPFSPEIWRLYSREFFALLARHLKPNGVVAMDCPLGFEKKLTKVLISNIQYGGFGDVLAFQSNYDRFFAAKQTKEPLSLKYKYFGFEMQAIQKNWFENKERWRLYKKPSIETSKGDSIFRPRFANFIDYSL